MRSTTTSAIEVFVEVARRFCDLVETGVPETSALAKSLADLNSAAVRLPDVETEEDEPEANDPAPLRKITLPLDVYWDVFDPFTTPPEEPVANSFYEDISDIRHDLRRGLDLYDRGFPLAACREWRFSFQTHWGEHLVGAQRALYLARTNELAP